MIGVPSSRPALRSWLYSALSSTAAVDADSEFYPLVWTFRKGDCHHVAVPHVLWNAFTCYGRYNIMCHAPHTIPCRPKWTFFSFRNIWKTQLLTKKLTFFSVAYLRYRFRNMRFRIVHHFVRVLCPTYALTVYTIFTQHDFKHDSRSYEKADTIPNKGFALWSTRYRTRLEVCVLIWDDWIRRGHIDLSKSTVISLCVISHTAYQTSPTVSIRKLSRY